MKDWVFIGALMAAASAAGAMWGHIKAFWDKLTSLVIVTVRIEGNFEPMMAYAWARFKKVDLGSYTYDVETMWVRPLQRAVQVACEIIRGDSVLFMYGWKPIWLRRPRDGGVPVGAGGDPVVTSISFIRGTFSPDDFVLAALESFNNRFFGEQDRRFIRRMIGRIGGKDDKPEKTSQDTRSGPWDMHHRSRVLKWQREDLGFLEPKIRAMDMLSLNEEAQAAVTEAQQWIKSREWYQSRFIPWKRGWLLYGQPGTGKTALVRAMSQELNIPVCIFDLSTMDNYWFIQSWEQMCEMAPVIALLEDIDNVFNKRKSLVKNGMGFSPMTFDCLLNCIDGVQKTDGVFTIITTNDETKIDDALGVVGLHQISTRPGRIDRIVRMTNPDEDGRRKIANRILAGFQSEVEAAVTAGAEETGAQFQDRCARLALQLYWKSQERMD